MKKIILLAIILIINSYDTFSQYLKPERSTIACNKEYILFIAEEMPKLQVNIDTLEYFLNQNLKLANGINNQAGNLDIGFIISCRGEAGDYHLIKTNIENLYDPIIKLLKEKCKWKPGRQKNYDIDMYCSFSITLSRGKLKIRVQNYSY